MKKGLFFISLLAALSLVACGGKGGESVAPSSAAPSSAQKSSSKPSSPKPSSSAAPATSKEAIPEPDPNTPEAGVEEVYYELPFGNGVTDENTKWEKGKTYTWKFENCEAQENVSFAIGAKMSSSNHSSRSLYTDHNNASADDPFESNADNDNTPRIIVLVNGVRQQLFTYTYGEAGLNNSEMKPFKVAGTFSIPAGDVEVSLTTNASCGYRLILGGYARLYYPKPVVFEGYNVTFTTEHCKVLVFEGKKYDQTPVETNTTKAMDPEGNIIPYDAETDEGPQVNFKVVCDENYSVSAANIKVTGAAYKNLKQNPAKSETPAYDDESLFRITKVQGDIQVEVKAVAGEQDPGYRVTFVPTNCTIVVYVGPKNADGTNIDTAEVIFTRSSDTPYGYSLDSKCQVNFGVVCDAGYEFVPTIGDDNKVDFVQGTYNKFQDKGGYFNITKVGSNLTVTITATQIQA